MYLDSHPYANRCSQNVPNVALDFGGETESGPSQLNEVSVFPPALR
jgi:hypothetical protein